MALIGLLKMRITKNILLLPLTIVYIVLAIVILFIKMLCAHYIQVEASTKTFIPHQIKKFKRNRNRKNRKNK